METQVVFDSTRDRTTKEPRDLAADERAALRRALRETFDIEPPSQQDARDAFNQGISLIQELESASQIDASTARTLTEILAGLYVNTIVNQFAEENFPAPRGKAPFRILDWWMDSLR